MSRTTRVVRVTRRSFKAFSEDDMPTYAAALAYQVFFSLFPFVIFLLSLLGVLNLSDLFDTLLGQARTVLPQDAFGLVQDVVAEVRGQAAGGVVSFGAIVALYTASAAVRRAMHAINVAHNVEETRPAWKRFPLSLLYTLLLAVLAIAAVGLFVLGERAVEWFAGLLELGPLFVTLWTWLHIPVAILLVSLILALVYHLFPNTKQPFRPITPGALIAVIVWVAASSGFSFYVQNFGSYSATYGALAAVIVLLLYLYISAAVLLFGAEVNSEIYREFAGGEERSGGP